jgi:hypothetical protein
MRLNKEGRKLRQAQELLWYHAGRKAFNDGVPRDGWPKIGELKESSVSKTSKGNPRIIYPRVRYAAKNTWQYGWDNAYHGLDNDLNGQAPPTPGDIIKLATDSLLTVAQRLEKTIDSHAPIRLRSLPGHFSQRDRREVIQLIREWAKNGVVELTGRGRRGRPFFVSKPHSSQNKTKPSESVSY